jgi:hypothetical protein
MEHTAAAGEIHRGCRDACQRPNDTRVRGAEPARKPVVGESMDGPASPAAGCQAAWGATDWLPTRAEVVSLSVDCVGVLVFLHREANRLVESREQAALHPPQSIICQAA